MKKSFTNAILVSGIALGLASLVGVAVAAEGQPVPAPGKRVSLDANGDGVIDRAEAAKAPRLAARFDQLDRNADGKLDAGEQREAFARRGGEGRGDGHGRGHGKGGGRGGIDGIARLDTDNDGRLSRSELEAGSAGRQGRPGHEGRQARAGSEAAPAREARPNPLLAQFDAIDSNRDGYLVRSELAAWHAAQRPQREADMRKRLDERFAAADLNGDGKLSRVEVDEKMPRVAKRFAWLDENRDGFLTRADLQPQRGH